MSDNQNGNQGARLLVVITVGAGLASIATLLFGDNLIGRLQGSGSQRSTTYANMSAPTLTVPVEAMAPAAEANDTQVASNRADALEDVGYNVAWNPSPNVNVTAERPRTSDDSVHPAFRK